MERSLHPQRLCICRLAPEDALAHPLAAAIRVLEAAGHRIG